MNPQVLSEVNVVNLMTLIVTGVGSELQAHARGGAVDREVVTFGEVVHDQCECGQLAVTLKRFFLSNIFPNDDSGTANPCGQPYIVAELGVSVARCVPVSDDDGTPPKPADLLEATYVMASDAYYVRTQTRCILQDQLDAHNIADYLIGAQTVNGPLSGCGGTELLVMVGYINPLCSC